MKSSAKVSLFVLYGPGGMGKTRLLIKMVEYAKSIGWIAGFLQDKDQSEIIEGFKQLSRKTFIVVDYAASHPYLGTLLVKLLMDHYNGKFPLRIMLLERRAGYWVESLKKKISNMDVELYGVERISETLPDNHTRTELFAEALNAFQVFRKKEISMLHAPKLYDKIFSRVLYIHMAALASLDNHEAESGKFWSNEKLITEILKHERSAWLHYNKREGEINEDKLERFVRRCDRVMTIATLRNGVLLDDVSEKFGLNKSEYEDVFDYLGKIYPSLKSSKQQIEISPLEPDVLGEWLVYECLEKDPKLLELSMQGAGRKHINHAIRILCHLIELEKQKPVVWLKEFLDQNVEERFMEAFYVLLNIGNSFICQQVADTMSKLINDRFTEDQLEEMKEKISSEHSSWFLFKSAILEQMVSLYPSASENKVVLIRRASILMQLGYLYSKAARFKEAIGVWVECDGLHNFLMNDDDEYFSSEHLTVLNNLSVAYSKIGNDEKSLTTIIDYVILCRKQCKTKSKMFKLDLALGLQNLCSDYIGLMIFDAALEAIDEAISIREEFYSSVNGLHISGSDGLDEFRIISESHGDFQEQMECVGYMITNFGREYMDKNAQLLALGYSSKRDILDKMSRKEEALEVAKKSVEIMKKLVAKDADTYMDRYASCLNGLALSYLSLKDYSSAIIASLEALGFIKKVFHIRKTVYVDKYVNILKTLGICYLQANQIAECVELIEKSINELIPFIGMNPQNNGRLLRELTEFYEGILVQCDIEPASRGVYNQAVLILGQSNL